MRVDFVDKTLDRPSRREPIRYKGPNDYAESRFLTWPINLAIRIETRKQRTNRVPRRRRPREVEDAVVRS